MGLGDFLFGGEGKDPGAFGGMGGAERGLGSLAGAPTSMADLLQQYSAGNIDQAGMQKYMQSSRGEHGKRFSEGRAARAKQFKKFKRDAIKAGARSNLTGAHWKKAFRQKYGRSKFSRKKEAKGLKGLETKFSSLPELLATSAGTSDRYAREKMLADPTLAGLIRDTEDLGGQQTQDATALGQASGDITRLAGQEEQNLAQMLQQRGLASAPSGAAGMGFSGIAGNRFERLAKAQTDIADRRMNRLQQNRQQYMQELGAKQQRGFQARGQRFGEQESAADRAFRQRQAKMDQENQRLLIKQQTESQGLIGSLASGVGGAAAGGFGSSVGQSLAKSSGFGG